MELPIKNSIYYIKLFMLISFLIFTLSYLLLTLTIEYGYFLSNTFLVSFSNLLTNQIFRIGLQLLKIVSGLAFVGCLISFLMFLYYDFQKIELR